MEVIVRNLDELADLMLVFFQRLIWMTPRLRTRFAAVFACLMCANVTQSSPITWIGAEPFADPKVVEPARSRVIIIVKTGTDYDAQGVLS